MRSDKKSPLKSDKKTASKIQKKGAIGYNKKSALLEDAITQMNAGKYGRASSALKELLALDPLNAEARRLFATLHLRLGSLMSARTAFESLAREALERQDYWLAESLLREYLIAGPRCVPFLAMLGHVYEEKGDAMAAVGEYGKAVEVLLEDPDPENPNRASELYAKIRDLAPGSPVAFRFAAMFDPTTGQVLAPVASPVASTPGGDAPSEAPASEIAAEPSTVSNPAAEPGASVRSEPLSKHPLQVEAIALETAPFQFAAVPGTAEATAGPATATPDSSPSLEVLLGRAEPPTSRPGVVPVAPVAPEAATVPPAATTSAPSPMPWEQIDAPTSTSSTAATEPVSSVPAPSFGLTGSLDQLSQSASASIADAPAAPAPMPWEQMEETSAIVPPPAPPEPLATLESVSIPEPPPDVPAPTIEVLSQPTSAPIAEAPASPAPMPWDQVQEIPVDVPPPSEPRLEAETDQHITGSALVEPTLTVPAEADQAIPPVPSEAASPTISWEDILKVVGQLQAESTPAEVPSPVSMGEPAAPVSPVEPTVAVTPSAPTEEVASELKAEIPDAFSSGSIPEGPPLPAPMPWEQVEHDTVAIPRRESEPEFGSIPMAMPPGSEDPTLILQAPLEAHLSSATDVWQSVSDNAASVQVNPTSSTELRILSPDSPIEPVSKQDRPIHIPLEAFEPVEESSDIDLSDSQPSFHVPTVDEVREPSSPTAPEPPAPVASESTPMPVPQPAPMDIAVPTEPAAAPFAASVSISYAAAPPIESAPSEVTVSDAAPVAAPAPATPVEETPSLAAAALVPESLTARIEPVAASHTEVPSREAPSTPQAILSFEPVQGAATPVVEPAPAELQQQPVLDAEAAPEPRQAPPKGRKSRSRGRKDKAPAAEGAPIEPAPLESQPVVETPRMESVSTQSEVTSAAPAASAVEASGVAPEPIAPTSAAPQPAPTEAPTSAPAAAGEIQILWDDSKGKSSPSSSGGLLSRWLKKPEAQAPSAPPQEPAPEATAEASTTISRREAAASAVDILFDRSSATKIPPLEEPVVKAKPRKPVAGRALNRMRLGLTLFLSTCFSTTRSLVLSVIALVGLVAALAAMAVGGAGLTWIFLEEQPNAAYHNLTSIPQRTLQDPAKNGYFLLLGFGGPTTQDPVLAGFERKVDESDLEFAKTCLSGEDGRAALRQGASAEVLGKWFRGMDPASQMKAEATGVRSWTAQADVSMSRYRQWLKMPFEDWGYGQAASPNCGLILYAHRLYVAEGFAQDQETGLERLETDMGAWRAVLGHAKTLPVKMLASAAVNDDSAVVSGLLLRPDLDERTIGRLSKLARPLDQVEQSMRWPMQSQFVSATKTVDQALKSDKSDARPFYVSVAAALPLPKQRRFNDYAEYYEAASKAASEGRYANLPKLGQFVRTPAEGITDYLVNPIENIIGLEPLPSWEQYGGRVMETDARLRLAGLQAWLRRTPPEQDLLTRVAKAGQTLYDPFTGFPMLVNMKRGVFYSVGHDMKDNDANSQFDVVAQIPLMPGQDAKRTAVMSRPK